MKVMLFTNEKDAVVFLQEKLKKQEKINALRKKNKALSDKRKKYNIIEEWN